MTYVLAKLHFTRTLYSIHLEDSDPSSTSKKVPLLQDFKPRIHVTDSDFASITENGALCDESGQLGPVRLWQSSGLSFSPFLSFLRHSQAVLRTLN